MSKNIILCCDGTGQQFQQNRSNPLRLHYCLDNANQQISFYDPGVGTFDPGGTDYSAGVLGSFESSLTQKIEGSGEGVGIVQNIRDAYRYLMSVFDNGDAVYVFGFSRGAFTAQAVTGMLNKCGLLYPHNENLIPYAIRIYLKKGNDRIAGAFKSTMARPCKPRMIGVWDTVKSLGPHYDDDYFYRKTAENCEYGYQALSVDEKREDFIPSLWTDDDKPNIEQVWFPGVHCDVGGGYPEDGLSNAPLRWMIQKARACGVRFHKDRVEEFVPNCEDTIHESYEGWWRLRGSHTRDIKEGSNIHESAIERDKKVGSYKPGNLPKSYNVIKS